MLEELYGDKLEDSVLAFCSTSVSMVILTRNLAGMVQFNLCVAETFLEFMYNWVGKTVVQYLSFSWFKFS